MAHPEMGADKIYDRTQTDRKGGRKEGRQRAVSLLYRKGRMIGRIYKGGSGLIWPLLQQFSFRGTRNSGEQSGDQKFRTGFNNISFPLLGK